MRVIGVAVFFVVLSSPVALVAHDPPGGGDPTPPGIGGDGPYVGWNVLIKSRVAITDIGGTASTLGSDIWGWADPLTGREYAIFGLQNQTSFIDVTNPAAPVYLGGLPTATGTSLWREVRTYQNHAYIVSDNNGAHGMQVFDLTRLRNVSTPQVFTADARYTGFGPGHTVHINEDSGFAYVAGSNTFSGGLHIVDIRNPKSPVAAGGFAGDGYTHDMQVVNYRGPDSQYVGREISFSCNEDTLTLVDVTNKTAPTMIARKTYAGARYVHQGWLTEDQKYFIQNDELDEYNNSTHTRTHVWNVSDLDNPVYVGYHEFDNHSHVIDHNLFIKGNLVFEANYTSGLRILALTDPSTALLEQVGFLDTYPTDDATNFNGAWGNYPFLPSGTILIGDRQNGLFVVQFVGAPEPGTMILCGIAVLIGGVTVYRKRARSTNCSPAPPGNEPQ